MYVGDSPSHDVTPPKSIGMLAAWARRAARFTPSPNDREPDHVVDDFVQLRELLRTRHGLDV